MHSCRIFATTPGDLSSEKKCQSALKIVNDAVEWKEKYYDVSPIEFKRYIHKKSNYRVVYIEYNYNDLLVNDFYDKVSDDSDWKNAQEVEFLPDLSYIKFYIGA